MGVFIDGLLERFGFLDWQFDLDNFGPLRDLLFVWGSLDDTIGQSIKNSIAQLKEGMVEDSLNCYPFSWVNHQNLLYEIQCLWWGVMVLGEDVVTSFDLLVSGVSILGLKRRDSEVQGVN